MLSSEAVTSRKANAMKFDLTQGNIIDTILGTPVNKRGIKLRVDNQILFEDSTGAMRVDVIATSDRNTARITFRWESYNGEEHDWEQDVILDAHGLLDAASRGDSALISEIFSHTPNR